MRITRQRAVAVLAAGATLPFASRARAQTATPVRAAMIPIEPASLIYYASYNVSGS